MGRKPNTAVRRQEIIEALLHEMSAAGYERSSIKSIAAAAGLTPGLVHYHFKSKEEILLALIDGLIDKAEQDLAEAMESSDSPAGKLKSFVSSRVGFGPKSDSTQVKAWVGILAEAMGQAGVRSRVAKWLGSDLARLSHLFSDARSSAPREHASLLVAMILGSFSLHAIDAQGVPRGYAERQIQQWLLQTIDS